MRTRKNKKTLACVYAHKEIRKCWGVDMHTARQQLMVAENGARKHQASTNNIGKSMTGTAGIRALTELSPAISEHFRNEEYQNNHLGELLLLIAK